MRLIEVSSAVERVEEGAMRPPRLLPDGVESVADGRAFTAEESRQGSAALFTGDG